MPEPDDLSKTHPRLLDYGTIQGDPHNAKRMLVCMVHEDRTLLGEIVSVHKAKTTSGWKAKVKHFNGEEWPIVPLFESLFVIACRECKSLEVEAEAGDRLCAKCQAKLGEEYDNSPTFGARLNNVRENIDTSRTHLAPVLDCEDCFAPEHLRIADALLIQAKAHIDLAELHSARETGGMRVHR